MIAVIFEVETNPGEQQTYLDLAAHLRPALDGIDGFISVERFQSLANPSRMLSLSFWRDEEAVSRWRNTEPHRQAQHEGRSEIFRDYRLRVAAVIRDYGLHDRVEAPPDSNAVHDLRGSPARPRPRLDDRSQISHSIGPQGREASCEPSHS